MALISTHTTPTYCRAHMTTRAHPQSFKPAVFRLDDHAPSSSIDGATMTSLTRGLQDPYLAKGDRLPLLNQLSVVVAGVFEAALRCDAPVGMCVCACVRVPGWHSYGFCFVAWLLHVLLLYVHVNRRFWKVSRVRCQVRRGNYPRENTANGAMVQHSMVSAAPPPLCVCSLLRVLLLSSSTPAHAPKSPSIFLSAP